MEGQLEVVGLELMAEGIMAGTHSKSQRERVPNVNLYVSELTSYEIFAAVIEYYHR